jgi:hypothetical protein
VGLETREDRRGPEASRDDSVGSLELDAVLAKRDNSDNQESGVDERLTLESETSQSGGGEEESNVSE